MDDKHLLQFLVQCLKPSMMKTSQQVTNVISITQGQIFSIC